MVATTGSRSLLCALTLAGAAAPAQEEVQASAVALRPGDFVLQFGALHT